MTHETWYERLEAYLDGELDDAARAAFEAETAADPGRQRALARRREFGDASRRALAADLPDDLADLAAACGRTAGHRSPHRRRDRRWIVIALAAALTLALVAPELLRNVNGAAGHRSPVTRSGQVVALRFGEVRGAAVTLEAGCYHRSSGECQ